MKKAFLFIALCFYCLSYFFNSLNAAVINETKSTGISLAQLLDNIPEEKRTDFFLVYGGCFLDIDNLNLNNIDDIENLEVLTNRGLIKIKNIPDLYLNLSNNQITDLSPLSSLTNLIVLNLSNNQITDLSPLSSLTELGSLKLSRNQIVDTSPLKYLTNLEELSLSRNQIVGISPLKYLTELQVLRLKHNHIIDISCLSSLTIIKELYLSNNQITYIPNLNLKSLNRLYLNNNQITYISNLNSFTQLHTLDLSNNKIIDISNICEYKKLEKLDLSNNKLTDLPDCIVNLEHLEYLNLYYSGLQIKIGFLENYKVEVLLKKLWITILNYCDLYPSNSTDKDKNAKTVIIIKNPDNSININISKFLTGLSQKKRLSFMPSVNQSEFFDKLPQDIKIYLSLFVKKRHPKWINE